MRLLEIKRRDGGTSVMHYMSKDLSRPAIEATIAKAGIEPLSWREITHDEYAAIRAGRNVPSEAPPEPDKMAELEQRLAALEGWRHG